MSPASPDRQPGRHRARHAGDRPRRGFSFSAVLPTVTAAALVVTAGAATMGQSAAGEPGDVAAEQVSQVLDLSATEARVLAADSAAEAATSNDLAQRRQAAGMQAAAVRGGAEAKQRAARAAKRKAVAEAAKRAAERKAAQKKAAARARAEREGKRWVSPIRSGVLTSGFGPRWGKTHDGLDIGAPTGTPLYAMSMGTVVLSDSVFSFGNKIEIRYWDGTVSWYGHLSSRTVSTGDTVMPGDQVGLVGNTGHSFGSHLHLEIHPTGGDNPVNPAPWLKRKGISVG